MTCNPEELEKYGFDIRGALHRFLNDREFYMTCVREEIADPEIERLKKACDDGDLQKTESSAFCLKGVMLNLGFDSLCKFLDEIIAASLSKSMEETKGPLSQFISTIENMKKELL